MHRWSKLLLWAVGFITLLLASTYSVTYLLVSPSPDGRRPEPRTFTEVFEGLRADPFRILVIFLLLITVGYVIRTLIRSGPFRSFTETLVGVDRDELRVDRSFEYKLDELLRRLSKTPRSTRPTQAAMSSKVEQEILGLYREALSKNLTPEIGTEIRKLIAAQVKREDENVAQQFLADVHSRLRRASSTVTVRGLINLGLGILFAGWALYTLNNAIALMTPQVLNTLSMSATLYLIATRISLAVVVTLVAYFFLALYRKGLDETKFYHNEMTDISSRAVALQMAQNLGDAAAITAVLTKFMESDRNRSSAAIAAGSLVDEKTITEVAKTLIDKLPKASG